MPFFRFLFIIQCKMLLYWDIYRQISNTHNLLNVGARDTIQKPFFSAWQGLQRDVKISSLSRVTEAHHARTWCQNALARRALRNSIYFTWDIPCFPRLGTPLIEVLISRWQPRRSDATFITPGLRPITPLPLKIIFFSYMLPAIIHCHHCIREEKTTYTHVSFILICEISAILWIFCLMSCERQRVNQG